MKYSPNVKCINLMNGNHLSNTSKGYLKSTNGPLLKAMNGKELYSILSLLKKEKKKTVVSLVTFVACWVLGKRLFFYYRLFHPLTWIIESKHKWNTENKTTNLIKWIVEDNWGEIKKTSNKDIAKKFEGKVKIMSLRLAKVQTRSLETSLSFRWQCLSTNSNYWS